MFPGLADQQMISNTAFSHTRPVINLKDLEFTFVTKYVLRQVDGSVAPLAEENVWSILATLLGVLR